MTTFKVHFLKQTIKSQKSHWYTVVGLRNGVPIVTCEITAWTTEVPNIVSMVVQKEHRSKGYGTDVIRQVINKCEAAGKSAVAINVGAKNKRARALYERIGFTPSLIASDGSLWMSLSLK